MFKTPNTGAHLLHDYCYQPSYNTHQILKEAKDKSTVQVLLPVVNSFKSVKCGSGLGLSMEVGDVSIEST